MLTDEDKLIKVISDYLKKNARFLPNVRIFDFESIVAYLRLNADHFNRLRSSRVVVQGVDTTGGSGSE